MATKKEKQELIDVLKFAPVTVRMLIQGYGGESYAGKVDRAVYDYFAEKQIDIEEYATDWDDKFSDKVPAELQPFSPGSPYDCDGLWHASGAELSDLNEIRVDADDGTEIWVHNCGYSDLENSGVTVAQWGGEDLDDLADDEVVFWGGQGEKGCFFDCEFTLRAPFDPKKLKVGYENCDGWYIINNVEYDGEELDGTGGYSTTGKWAENKWILGANVEAYDPVSCEDDEDDEEDELPTIQELEEDSEEWDPVAELDKISEDMMTDWYPVDTKPVRKGEYEVRNTHTPVWPFPATFKATWTGRTWKDSDGAKVENIIEWRGLNFDPTEVKFDYECVQCDWRGTVDEAEDNDGDLRCPECGEPVEMK
jgi:DNA-directed RNA polymerase subunit RPC12/RpoP